jgi:hypothetical protein
MFSANVELYFVVKFFLLFNLGYLEKTSIIVVFTINLRKPIFSNDSTNLFMLLDVLLHEFVCKFYDIIKYL